MQGKIALVVVGYNRPHSMRRILTSLDRAKYKYTDIPLIISIDHSGNEDVVRVANEFAWQYGEKKVLYRPERLGLRRHIIACGDMTKEYGAVMVLEDDLYVSPDFYNYAMEALDKYGDHSRIAGISLNTKRELLESSYPFFPLRRGEDVYFQQFATSWGQVWNERMWDEFRAWYDQNQELPHHKDMLPEVTNYPNTSWAKYYQTYVVSTGKYFVYSYDSLTTNFGDAGQHFDSVSSSVQSLLFYGEKEYRMPEFESSIKYDIYGEPEGLGAVLGVPEDELTCDMWGRKQPASYKRYVFSSKKLNYKILKSYGMQLKPMELNVYEQLEGDDLILYDTSIVHQNGESDSKKDRIRMLEYGYGVIDGRDLIQWSIARIQRKLKKKCKR